MLAIPRLTADTVEPQLAKSGLGDAFQRLVGEALEATRPDIRRFGAAGRDGGIDLLEERPDGRVVHECKYVGADGEKAAAGRWRETGRNLKRHLPARSQTQYAPWWDAAQPIRRYELHLSSALANAAQLDSLRHEISSFFETLGAAYNHLAHLRDIEVEVRHWPDFERLLVAEPRLVFRWFPRTRCGLLPLESHRSPGTLRAYLDTTYYSREHHVAEHGAPDVGDFMTEPAMLDTLREADGIVITGAGGYGKTRLSLEIGRRAQAEGWTVMRAEGPLRDQQLDLLAATSSINRPVLLLIDYIETQRAFAEATHRLAEINEAAGPVHFVANCRTSYYDRVAGTTRHVHVTLAPPGALDWYRDYRHEVVRHILESSGVGVQASYLKICRDIPVLAVFVAYLHATGRTTDLEDLQQDANFGVWMRRRVARSFPEVESADVAAFIAQFPMTDGTVDRVFSGPRAALLRALATDGWVEPTDRSGAEGRVWEVVHDVFTDQILGSYVEELGELGEAFLLDLLRDAAGNDCLRSAVIAVQRLGDRAGITQVRWHALFNRAIEANPRPWVEIADAVLLTPVLTPDEAAAILVEHSSLWRERRDDRAFHAAISALVRQVASQRQGAEGAYFEDLTEWMRRIIALNPSDYHITSALRLAPSVFSEVALEGIRSAAIRLDLHYMLVAWLHGGLGAAEVKDEVSRWISAFGNSPKASFVYHAWLDAGGELASVQDAVASWLVDHQNSPGAQYVYGAWLGAGGDLGLVAPAIPGWLAEHGCSRNASFLYRACLEAGVEPETLASNIEGWLAEHAKQEAAGSVYGAWLDAGGDPAVVSPAMHDWLSEHGLLLKARYLYRSALHAGVEPEALAAPVERWLAEHRDQPEAEHVFASWLASGGDPSLVESLVLDWIGLHGSVFEAEYVYKAWLDAARPREAISEAVGEWLKLHASNDHARFVLVAWLRSGGDPEFIESAINEWTAENAVEVDAQYVYVAWLKHGGDTGVIDAAVHSWVAVNGTRPEASHVYPAWLNAGGETVSMESDILRWISAHGETDDAEFVYRAWVESELPPETVLSPLGKWFHTRRSDRDAGQYMGKLLTQQRELPPEIVRDILAWCRTFSDEPDALWRLSRLCHTAHDPELGPAVVATAERLLVTVANKPEPVPDEVLMATFVLSQLAYSCRFGQLADRVDILLFDWFAHPKAFSHPVAAARPAESGVFASRALSLVHHRDFAVLDLPGFANFLKWLSLWTPENRDSVLPNVRALKRSSDQFATVLDMVGANWS